MKKERVLGVLVAMACAWSGAAHAATVLVTAPFQGATAIQCNFVNISKKNVEVRLEILDAAGTDLVNDDITIGSGVSLIGTHADGAWCRFTIVNGTAKSIRAAAFIKTATEFTMALPAF
jgi:hypothetical protein